MTYFDQQVFNDLCLELFNKVCKITDGDWGVRNDALKVQYLDMLSTFCKNQALSYMPEQADGKAGIRPEDYPKDGPYHPENGMEPLE